MMIFFKHYLSTKLLNLLWVYEYKAYQLLKVKRIQNHRSPFASIERQIRLLICPKENSWQIYFAWSFGACVWPFFISSTTENFRDLAWWFLLSTNMPLSEGSAWNKWVRICRPEYGSNGRQGSVTALSLAIVLCPVVMQKTLSSDQE